MDFPFPFLESLTLPVDAGPGDRRIVINEDNSGTIRVYDSNGTLVVQLGGEPPFDNAIQLFTGDPDEDFPATLSALISGVGATRNLGVQLIGPAFTSTLDFPFIEILSESFNNTEEARIAIDLDDSTRGKIRTPSNIGEAVLVAGTVAVARTRMTGTERIFLQRRLIGAAPGNLTYVVTAGVGFTINSDNAGDTGTIEWQILGE